MKQSEGHICEPTTGGFKVHGRKIPTRGWGDYSGKLLQSVTCGALPWASAACAASSWSLASEAQDTGLDVF